MVNNDDSISFTIWVLSKEEKEMVKRSIEGFKMQSFKGRFLLNDDLTRLKTHDWHKML